MKKTAGIATDRSSSDTFRHFRVPSSSIASGIHHELCGSPLFWKMMEDRVLTKEFASKFLVGADKWSKHRLRIEVWNETCKLLSTNGEIG